MRRLVWFGLLAALGLASACANVWGFRDLTVGADLDAAAPGDTTTGGDGPEPSEDGAADGAGDSPADGSPADRGAGAADADATTAGDAEEGGPFDAAELGPLDASDAI